MASTKLNTEGVMLFEHSLPRAPYERLRHSFRAQQKLVDREVGAVAAAASDLAKRAYDPADALSTVDGMIARIEALKARLAAHHEAASRPTQRVLRARLDHVSEIEPVQERTEDAYGPWATTRLDRWLVDWSLRAGHDRTAAALAQDRCVKDLVDHDVFADIGRIEAGLQSHSCAEALIWCNEHKIALRKAKSPLEFKLRMQEYIELCRQERWMDAIAYSRKHLAPFQKSSDEHAKEIQNACGLLCFTTTTSCGRYARLYSADRWTELAKIFRMASYELHGLPAQPLLYYATYAGLSALKVPACATSQPQQTMSSPTASSPTSHRHAHGVDADEAMGGTEPRHTGNLDCPVCDAGALGGLAQDVPSSHQVHSTLVCRITGKVMDADNEPMAFPSGHVYSKQALEDMAKRNDGVVKCPRTGETIHFTSLRKVFIS